MMKKCLLLLLVICFVAPALVQAEKPLTRAALRQGADLDSLAAMRHEVRNAENNIVTLETSFGKMVLELYRDVAPAHADSFLARCEDGFYSKTRFHRIIKNFMIQGGNPFPVGKENVTYYLPNELNNLPHKFGTLSMASRGSPTTAQTQFFICLGRNFQTKSLDGKYVVFGQLLKGFDVLYQLGQVEVKEPRRAGGERSQPVKNQVLRDAYRSDADGNRIE